MKRFLAISVSASALIVAGCSNNASATVHVDAQNHNGRDGAHHFDQDGDASLMAGDMRIAGRIGGDLSVIGSDLHVSAGIGGDMSLVGSDIIFEGSVGSEANIAGSDVAWSGNARGDVDIAGSDVNWSGTTERSLSIAGSDVMIDGRIGEDLDIAGSDIEVSRDSDVGGNLSMAGSDLELFGSVGGNASLAGSSAEIEGPVDGRLIAVAYSRRGWSWSSGNTHQRVRINAAIGEGSAVCARRVVIGPEMVITGQLAVFAEEAPVFEAGASQSSVTFEAIDGRDCNDLLEPFDR
ncbi:hypothetical protein [Hyphobacterium indicum]|uniref:hypothetical protein n=1 Tax=Hyphobacterium indicum TaxID=2162714 RepID=UPI000D64E0FB|nr:hypothetical protein [Hyphobacterium indicum]